MKRFQIAFVGINSLYGSSSALLLKQSPFVKCLKLFDPRDVEAGLDVATINTQCRVKTFKGHEQLENALREADIIVISDESSEMVDPDAHLMNVSANLSKYAKAISRASPDAIIVVASPPVNCLLPIMSRLLAKAGCYNHNKVVGSTSVDTMRASALLARHLNMDPNEVVLPVIGGSSDSTRVPIFSQSRPHFSLKKDLKRNLIMEIRRGDSLVLANKGRPEALNRAYSTVRFLNSIMAGLRGNPNVTDITLCRTDLVKGVEYFSLPAMFGREGIIKRFGVPKTTASEDEMVEEAIKHVKKDTDKADYIVRAAVELPEHKYLVANKSSQKDMFDLFVKPLPKPQDKNQNTRENESKKASGYSFTSFIKEDSTRDPFEAFDKNPHRHKLAKTLKNITLADGFLKSVGGYTSPFQKPILILEPLGCPSRPLETDGDGEIEETVESEDVLHEKNLASFSGNETFEKSQVQNVNPSPTKNQPFLLQQMVKQKIVDPIANFKAIAKFHEYRKPENKPERSGSPLNLGTPTHEAVETFEECELHTNRKPGIATTNATNIPSNKKKGRNTNSEKYSSFSNPRKNEMCEGSTSPARNKEVHFSSPSGRCMKKKYGSANKTDSYVFDIKTNRMIPRYNLYKKRNEKVDYIPEEENGKSYVPQSDVEESLYNHGRPSGMENDEQYKKLVTRLLKTLNGLTDGFYFPLKDQGEDIASTPKCKKSFTESAVRLRSPNSGSLIIRKKIRGALESGDMDNFPQADPKTKRSHSGGNLMQEMKNQSKRSHKKAAQFQDVQSEGSISHQNQEAEMNANNKELQFVCPKCQNRITCQPEKTQKYAKPQVSDSEECGTDQQDERENKRIVVKQVHKGRGRQCSTQNEVFATKTSFDDNLQEERLKKLKEKINEKLIPMMKQAPELSKFTDDSSVLATSGTTPKPAKFETSVTALVPHQPSTGSSLVLTKKSEPQAKHLDVAKAKSNLTIARDEWQGVPFVLSRHEKKENKDGKNWAVFMKLVAPPTKNEHTKGEDEVVKNHCTLASNETEDKVDRGIEVQSESNNPAVSECDRRGEIEKRGETILNKLQIIERKSGKSTANIPSNKLQLLESEGRKKVGNTANSEIQEKNEVDIFHKEQLRREINLPLKADDVQNYMMTRQRGSENILVKEIMNKNFGGNPSAVFEKADFEHLKSDNKKDISPDISSESKTDKVRYKTNPNNWASDENQIEQTAATANSKNVKNKDRLAETKALAFDSKGAVSVENKDGKDAENEIKAEKTTTKESSWAMTSPSKNFESIEEPTMSTNMEDKINGPKVDSKELQTNPKMQSDKKVTQKLTDPAKSSTEPSVMIFRKTTNKLQLLASARISKQTENNAFHIKVQRKLKNVWEKSISEKPVRNKIEVPELPRGLKHIGAALYKLEKKSAAVKIAKKSNFPVPRKSNSYRTNGVTNDVAILDGLTFPARRKRRPTNNLLKELASVCKRREAVKSVIPKAKLKRVVKRAPVKPLARVHLAKDRTDGIKPGTSLEPQISEYAQDEMQMAKLVSEILKKKTLRSASDFKNHEWRHSKVDKTFSTAHKRKIPRDFVSVERPRSSLFELGTSKNQNGQAAQKPSDVAKNLTSMPHVRHQVENFELPLGPLEVQPGLAQFSYGKVGVFSPIESGWGTPIVNEYARSNILPSLRDTRETFYLEEHPS